jgi:hypothetical protein
MKHKHELITFAAFIVVIFLFLFCIAITNTLRDKKGDINHDGRIGIDDIMILQSTLEKDVLAIDYSVADMNSDGIINQSDLDLIGKAVVLR